jgi:hypothetical protein
MVAMETFRTESHVTITVELVATVTSITLNHLKWRYRYTMLTCG